MSGGLALSLFGALQISLDQRPLSGIVSDKCRALLVYLAFEADRPHRRGVLAELFWPNKPHNVARNSLKQALASLRQALGDRDSPSPFLLVSRHEIQFNPNSEYSLDVHAFLEKVENSEKHVHKRLEHCNACRERLRQAVEIYQGDFLEAFSLPDSQGFEEWALLHRENFRRRMADALRKLVIQYVKRKMNRQARQYARRLVNLEPWNEENHRVLMRLLAASGRRSEALKQYQACQRLLADEFGVGPTNETIMLYESIRDGAGYKPSEMMSHLADEVSRLPPTEEMSTRKSLGAWVSQLPRWAVPTFLVILVGGLLLTGLVRWPEIIASLTGDETIAPTDRGVGEEKPPSPFTTGEALEIVVDRHNRWYVSTAGDNTNDCRRPENPCASINVALMKEGFLPGDTVFVSGGVFSGTGTEVALFLHDVILSGGWSADFTSQDTVSIIDGENERRCITVHSGVTARVERFALLHGSSMNGGGVLNGGTLTLSHSSVQDNLAIEEGGGINIQSEAILILDKSTISSNVAISGGGVFNAEGKLHGQNCTISNNTAEGGGGINNLGGIVRLNNCTVVFNNVSPMGGGGIRNEADGVVDLQNTILAGNAGFGPNCNGVIVSSGYNLIETTSDCDFIATIGDLINTDAHVDGLKDNGGLTLTHRLLQGSPAIDAGNPGLPGSGEDACEADDQRDVLRPIDGDAMGASRCDIGAYELDEVLSVPAIPPSGSKEEVRQSEREALVRLYHVTGGAN